MTSWTFGSHCKDSLQQNLFPFTKLLITIMAYNQSRGPAPQPKRLEQAKLMPHADDRYTNLPLLARI